jgi:hypothetical protein
VSKAKERQNDWRCQPIHGNIWHGPFFFTRSQQNIQQLQKQRIVICRTPQHFTLRPVSTTHIFALFRFSSRFFFRQYFLCNDSSTSQEWVEINHPIKHTIHTMTLDTRERRRCLIVGFAQISILVETVAVAFSRTCFLSDASNLSRWC